MKKKGLLWIVLGLLLIAAAFSIIGYNVVDNIRAKHASQKALQELEAMIKDMPEVDYPEYMRYPDMEMPVKKIDDREYVGMISLPSIGRELPVISDWNYENLETAPCRYAGSAYKNNMVICAHNYDSHFGLISNLNYGDSIIFTDMVGNVFEYRVTEVVSLEPTENEIMKNGEWDLTLFTCTLNGADRVTVRCELIDK
ncbi:MAG: sortase [Lachnospiraceae bacterium]|nr:sortase [Lachnospiraceae bacterium]